MPKYSTDQIVLRDKIALSVKVDSIPEINNQEGMSDIAKELGIEINLNDTISIIQFAVKYESYYRYLFADAMMAQRLKNLKSISNKDFKM